MVALVDLFLAFGGPPDLLFASFPVSFTVAQQASSIVMFHRYSKLNDYADDISPPSFFQKILLGIERIK